jgi:hypothetical protein
MLHHIATISFCYGGHFESKMTAKIQKSSDLGEIFFPLFVATVATLKFLSLKIMCTHVRQNFWKASSNSEHFKFFCFFCGFHGNGREKFKVLGIG